MAASTMSAEDSPAVLFDQDLVRVARLVDAPGGEPAGHAFALDVESQTLLLGNRLLAGPPEPETVG
jgi:hypothetical protein